jgi:hypothetical protein
MTEQTQRATAQKGNKMNTIKIAGRMPSFIRPMRDAVRDGRKTVTRRVAKDQPPEGDIIVRHEATGNWYDQHGNAYDSPYRPGEIRYMTEPLVEFCGYACYQDCGLQALSAFTGKPMPWRWKVRVLTARFMPSEAARTFCRIDSVRPQRLQDITEADAVAEGTKYYLARGGTEDPEVSMSAQFRALWDSINLKRGHGWERNDWVWRIAFSKVEFPQ